jgi:VanZ family protein
VLLFGLLAFVTWQALRQQPTHPAIDAPDKLLHALAFAALAVPLRLLLAPRGAVAASAWAAIALMAYGAAIEGVQATLPYRSAEWGDLLADAVGVGLGLSLAWGLRRWAVGAPRAGRR